VSLVQQFVEFIEQAPIQSLRAVCERILAKCRSLTGAEAGTIFIVRRQGRRRWLEAVSAQNDSLPAADAAFVIPVDETSIAGYVAVTGETLFIGDAYHIGPEHSFRFNPGFDRQTGFHTQSILCFALSSLPGRIIGVVQLINRREPGERLARPFLPEHEAMIAPVNHIVGHAIERADAMERISLQNLTLRERNRELRQERQRVERLQHETERAFRLSVDLLARAAELHDADTGNHISRVSEYAALLARLARQPKRYCAEIAFSATLHDVGKMSVDKAVLLKPGRLDERELVEMRRHTLYGHAILRDSERLGMAAEIARSHHEQWAGSGYPDGLAGEAIPLSARVVAIADVYDALRSARPYKAPIDHAQALAIMTRGDDRLTPAQHFDPHLLSLFVEHHPRFEDIWQRFADEG